MKFRSNENSAKSSSRLDRSVFVTAKVFKVQSKYSYVAYCTIYIYIYIYMLQCIVHTVQCLCSDPIWEIQTNCNVFKCSVPRNRAPPVNETRVSRRCNGIREGCVIFHSNCSEVDYHNAWLERLKSTWRKIFLQL